MALPKTRLLRWAIPLVLLAALIAGRSLWLRALGNYLVVSQPPVQADLVVVLAGDEHGDRMLEAARLVKDGYAPQVLVSGPCCCYGHLESDLAIDFAVRHGFPAQWFINFPVHSDSTRTEAAQIVAELDRRQVRRFLLVTSNYHTRRAASVYRALVGPERFRVVAAPDWAFHGDGWWHTRGGRKQVFFEWAKTVGYWFGL